MCFGIKPKEAKSDTDNRPNRPLLQAPDGKVQPKPMEYTSSGLPKRKGHQGDTDGFVVGTAWSVGAGQPWAG